MLERQPQQLPPRLAGVPLAAGRRLEQLGLLVPLLRDVAPRPQHEVQVVLRVDGVVNIRIRRDLEFCIYLYLDKMCFTLCIMYMYIM